MLFWVKNKIWWLGASHAFAVMIPKPAELSCSMHRMLILVQKMLRWLIPHLPIQASTLAVKSKTVVVDMALDSWNCTFYWLDLRSSIIVFVSAPCNRRNSFMLLTHSMSMCGDNLSTIEHVGRSAGAWKQAIFIYRCPICLMRRVRAISRSQGSYLAFFFLFIFELKKRFCISEEEWKIKGWQLVLRACLELLHELKWSSFKKKKKN